MNLIKRILFGLFILFVAFVAISYLLPSQFNVARSVSINAAPEKIYPLIANTREWKNWTAWNRRDPNMKIRPEIRSWREMVVGKQNRR